MARMSKKPGKVKNVGGRPPEEVPADKAETILIGLDEGQTLTSLCEQIGIIPRTVSKWKAKDERFRTEFAQARIAGAAIMVDRAQDIADNATPKDVQVAKLRVDTMLKRAACFAPDQFGAKAQIEHSGTVTLEKLVLEAEKRAT